MTTRPRLLLLPHGKTLDVASPQVMGVVNVTPDSFSDGGLFGSMQAAVAQGERLVREGAAILDVGGESTRPKARAIGAAEEMDRVLPVIRALRARVDVPLSIDTMKAAVAEAAIGEGASIINDIWGFHRDPGMAPVVARTGAAAIVMHNRGHDNVDAGIDIIADVLRFLERSLAIATAAGVAADRMIVDPGFGFGKTDAQNLSVVRDLAKFGVLGCPILLGVSRKSTLGRLTGEPVAAERLGATLAAGLWGLQAGATILRVHDVAPHVQALKVLRALREEGPQRNRAADADSRDAVPR